MKKLVAIMLLILMSFALLGCENEKPVQTEPETEVPSEVLEGFLVTRKYYIGSSERELDQIRVLENEDALIPTIEDLGYQEGSYWFIESHSNNFENITEDREVYVYLQQIQHRRITFSDIQYTKEEDGYSIDFKIHMDEKGGDVTFVIPGLDNPEIRLFPGEEKELTIFKRTKIITYIIQEPYQSWSYFIYDI